MPRISPYRMCRLTTDITTTPNTSHTEHRKISSKIAAQQILPAQLAKPFGWLILDPVSWNDGRTTTVCSITVSQVLARYQGKV
jgi:hypothetical protein